jgi:hypothetical protein
MVIFGGIFEVTKELDDLLMFDLKARKWHVIFEEALNSPTRKGGMQLFQFSNAMNRVDSPLKSRSPSFRKKNSIYN